MKGLTLLMALFEEQCVELRNNPNYDVESNMKARLSELDPEQLLRVFNATLELTELVESIWQGEENV